MPDLYLGVDAGGTKTHAAIMDESGRIIGLGVAGTGNPERIGFAGATATLQAAINGALGRSGSRRHDVGAATFALAGIDWESDASAMAAAGNGFGLDCKPHIVNDAVAVLFAGTRDGIGCASVAGTGGKTVASDGEVTVATLGIGIGEGGGAAQIVAETLTMLALIEHGQRSPSLLQEAVLGAAGFVTISELFQAIARDGFSLSESFAPAVVELADGGDWLAAEVVEIVARHHAADVVGLVDPLRFDGRSVDVVCAGGLHTADSDTFQDAFAAGVAVSRWTLRPVVLSVPPVVGALVHAVVRAKGTITERQRSHLLESAHLLAADLSAASPF